GTRGSEVIDEPRGQPGGIGGLDRGLKEDPIALQATQVEAEGAGIDADDPRHQSGRGGALLLPRTPPRVQPPDWLTLSESGRGGALLVRSPGAGAAPPRRWPRVQPPDWFTRPQSAVATASPTAVVAA